MEAPVSHEDHSYRVSIAVGFAIAITCVAIFLRLLARKIQKVPLGADDFVILAGAVSLASANGLEYTNEAQIFTIGTAITFIYCRCCSEICMRSS